MVKRLLLMYDEDVHAKMKDKKGNDKSWEEYFKELSLGVSNE